MVSLLPDHFLMKKLYTHNWRLWPMGITHTKTKNSQLIPFGSDFVSNFVLTNLSRYIRTYTEEYTCIYHLSLPVA